MGSTRQLTAGPEDGKKRLDLFLKEHLGKEFSRSRIQKWMKAGAVLCNGRPAAPAQDLHPGDRVELSIPEEGPAVPPEDIPLDVLYEDETLLVVNKPAGMVTHPGIGNPGGTLVNAAAHHLLKSGAKRTLPLRENPGDESAAFRPGVVHRLDKETSGALIIAKTPHALERLSDQFRDREVEKAYRAIVCGRVAAARGEVEGAIGKGYRTSKMDITASGRFSRTEFKVLESFPQHTYLEVYPKTGRTHQIRVHLSKIGYPVLGDKVYGGAAAQPDAVPRQMLHAYSIAFLHPAKKKRMLVVAPLPADFLAALKKLKS